MSTIHPSAIVEEEVVIGEGTRVWHFAHLRKGCRIGKNCILSKGVFVDFGVTIADNVKIQNNATVYHGVNIEEGVFVGPHVCFTNDLHPRAVTPDMKLKQSSEWSLITTQVGKGSSIGAQSTIVAGITIGCWAMIGAGSVVTKSIPDYALAYGNPARLVGVVSPSGEIVAREFKPGVYKDLVTQTTFEVHAHSLR